MSEVYTTVSWKPNAGEEAAFVEAWLQLAPAELEVVATVRAGSVAV